MSDSSQADLITPDRLRRGDVIRAVLHCDREAYTNQPEVEVLELPVLFGRGDNVWAFSRSLHGPISPLGARGMSCAYGYSTRYGAVANASHSAGLARIYDLWSYAGHRFVAASGGEAVWQRGEDPARLREAIEAGRKLRVVLNTADELTVALEVHLAEYHSPRDVVLYTEYDAVPVFVFAADFLEQLAARLAATRAAAAGKRVFAGFLDPQRTAFESLYFRISTGGGLARWDAATQAFGTPEPWKQLTILAR